MNGLRAHSVSLSNRLAVPAGAVGFDALTHHWRHTTICVDAFLPPHFDDGVGLPARIRGALGWALLDGAGKPRRRGGASAYEVLFGEHGEHLPRHPIPKPYVLAVTVSGVRLTVRLTLFGFAAAWAEDVRAALLSALEGGIALFTGARVRASIQADEVRIARAERITIPPATLSMVVLFRTPVSVRSGETLVADGARLVRSLINRVSGMARWQDLEVVEDDTLDRAIASLQFDISRLRVEVWKRHSTRTPTKPLPMRGLIGAMEISGDLEPLMPLLALGATCHMGSQAALGLGRYELAPVLDTANDAPGRHNR